MNFTISEVDSSENLNTFLLNYMQIQNIPIQNIPIQNELIENELIENEPIQNEQKFNTYICGICNTEPSLLRKHELHLKSKEHVNNKNNFKILITPYILNLIPINDEWKQIKRKYFINENYDSHDNLNLLKLCQKEKNRSFNLDDENDKIEYFNWKIDRIILDVETIQKNTKDEKINNYDPDVFSYNRSRNNYNRHNNNFNLDEINFILNHVDLDEIKNLITSRIICSCSNSRCVSCSEKNENLIIKQIELFERKLNFLINNYECNNLNQEIFMRKNAIRKANINNSILTEILYILLKNNLSYDILEVTNKLRVNYNVNNFSNDELKFVWIYKNHNGEFSIIDEEKLMKKFLIILQSLCCKLGIGEEYNYHNYLKQMTFSSSRKIFDMLKGLFLLNDLRI